MQLKHFTLSEFDSPDSPGSGSKMKPEFLQRLDNARSIAKIPFGINSGFRTVAHNAKVGGVDSSSHTQGWAADIACKTSESKLLSEKTCRAAAVVPLGLVTFWRNVCASKPLSFSIAADPDMVSIASLVAISFDNPRSTPALIIDSTKLKDELDWVPSLQFEEGLEKTVDWYLANENWLNEVTSGNYQAYYQEQYAQR